MSRGGHKIFIVAGEPSGDVLGGALLQEIRTVLPHVEVMGIGGPSMTEQGLSGIFPMEELSVMGVLEVLPGIPRILKRIHQTAVAIKAFSPDIVVTIDAPDFCFRVAKKLGKGHIPLVHYVAPTVWAWRPWRAKKVARYFHHLLALLPFEPPYFEAVGLPCTFVGHPISSGSFCGDGALFRERHGIAPDCLVIGLLPGSRKAEVRRHLPIFLEAIENCARFMGKPCHTVIPTVENTTPVVEELLEGCSLPVTIVREQAHKEHAFASLDVALAASGTVALELARASVPGVIAYRVAPLTAIIARILVRVPYVSLVNILENCEVTPELLQGQCNADNLARHLSRLLQDTGSCDRQIAGYQSALKKLHPGHTPSHRDGLSRAAITVLDLMNGNAEKQTEVDA